MKKKKMTINSAGIRIAYGHYKEVKRFTGVQRTSHRTLKITIIIIIIIALRATATIR